MVNHKKFLDIKVADSTTVGGFEVGDHIIIQTKVDGANAAIRYDSETDKVVAQSRKHILSSDNNLRGFYEWSQLLDKDRVKEVLGDRYVLFMEYSCPHKIKYAPEFTNKVFCYDAYDLVDGKWMPQSFVEGLAKKLGLMYVFTWYEGDFISWEHCKSFLGGSVYGEEQQEGIVIKSLTKLNDPNNRQPFYVKIVNKDFQESMKKKPKVISPEELAARDAEIEKTKSIVTRARVEKILYKGVDEGMIPEDWSAEDMKSIAKYVPKEVVEDCFKEEKDTVAEIENFTRLANKETMSIVKQILESKKGALV